MMAIDKYYYKGHARSYRSIKIEKVRENGNDNSAEKII
jgi:hypothetical protein